MAGGSYVVVLVAGLLAVSIQTAVSNDGFFEVFRGEWETCKRINSSVACYRTRDVHCRTVEEKKPAPWRYCSERGTGRPASVEECRCQQDCIVTKWSAWSPCSNGETYTTRRRAVAAPALRDGKPCPAMHEQKRCEMNAGTIAQLQRNHTWKVGRWQECAPIRQDSRQCGHGLRRRSVQCVDTRGRIVNETFCLQEEAYLRVLPPQVAQLCEVPCPCRVSVWGGWSEPFPNCTQPNPSLVRHRTRTILHHPSLGEHCKELEQFEVVDGDAQCPVYRWDTSGWSECSVKDERASCGVGLRHRYVYCIQEDIGDRVSTRMCNSSQMPSTLSSCEVPCSQDCVVSQWSGWSECRNDTCETTYSQRNRTILVQPSGRGSPCPHLTEFRECPQIPCASWSYAEWSACFPPSNKTCGWGTHSRTIACRDHRGMNINNELCMHLPHEDGVAVCYKHCLDDECVISDWSGWSECSKSCGNVTGTQTRSRYLVVNSSNCLHHEGEFFQRHNCTVTTPCEPRVFHVEVGSWGACQVPARAVADGDHCEGFQNRSTECFRDGQKASDCPIPFTPDEVQSCRALCSDQCILSEWSSFSECSGSCHKSRTRRLLCFGNNCPPLDSDGVQSETMECECSGEYRWVTTDSWSTCYLFPTPLSQLSQSLVSSLSPSSDRHCGQGYENRTVVCHSAAGEQADEGFCSAENKPPTFRSCVTPCVSHCIITDWSDHGVCSDRNQIEHTRRIVPFRDSDSFLDNCPTLESVVVVDAETCPSHSFSKFRWTQSRVFQELHDCYLERDLTCGSGMETSTYSCVANTAQHVAVSPAFCDPMQQLEKERTCNVPCNIDCEYSGSGWSVWSPCSVSCGMGYRTRTRTIDRVPQDGGRLCGHLNETTTCEMPACDYVEYSYSPQGICQPVNQTSGCGEGTAVSNPICLVNGVPQSNISACSSRLGPRGQKMLDCAVPCPGECVLSEWNEWRWCPECHTGCYTRKRSILRQGVNGCGEEGPLQQWEQCSANTRFTWSVGEWTDCVVDHHPRSERDYCGTGVQRRVVQCVLVRTGAVTYDGKCSHLPKPALDRGCSIPCPVDCVVGTFGEWHGCNRCTSDLKATMSHERRILVEPASGGRGCPHLVEEQSCPNIGCDEYFVETNSSALYCSSERTDQVCGQVGHTLLLCRKNNHYIQLEECMKANHSGLIVHNAPLLDQHDVYCDIPCPIFQECHFTKFGAWSQCLHMCDWPVDDRNISSIFSFQFRSRTLLGSWEGSRDRCHGQQQEVSFCTPNITVSDVTPRKCIHFDWNTSEWYTNDTREVQCHGNDSQVEEFACLRSEEPVSERTADKEGICKCPFLGECDGETTMCVCPSGYDMAGSLCLPIQGCLRSSWLEAAAQQCLPREVCGDDEECVCEEEDNCVPTPSNSSTTVETTEPDGTAANVTDILLIVLITCVPLLIFIVILLVIIIVTCKCRQHLDNKHRRIKQNPTILHQNQQLNNQPDLKDGGVRVQEVAPETTSHPMHVHNGSASSGFVDEMEHDILKYGQTSFNGYSQTQSEIDEAGFATDGNPYSPYPLPDPPSVPHTPLTPHPPYVPYEVEENGSVPFHSHRGNGMRPMEQHIPAHMIPRSLSEEARLARMSGGGVGGPYNRLVEEQEYPQIFAERAVHSGEYGGNYYPPSPGSQRAHPHTSHHHHANSGNGGRDNRLMIGLDNSMVRAIEEMTASEGGSRSPSVSSMGSRSSARRSRRRHHHRGYHPGSNGHGGYREPRIHSPINGPSHSAQGYYGYYLDAGDEYLSNTLPRSVSSKRSSPNMPQRILRQPVTTGASPLVTNVASPSGRYVRSASNEILETRRVHGVPSPLDVSHDMSHDVSHDQHGSPAQMPAALPDEYPLFHATNPLTITPPGTSSHISEDGDYDHITPSPVPPPPPRLVPPTAALAAPLQSMSSSTSPSSANPPPSSSDSQFPQELFQAIQKRANSVDTSPGVSRATAANSAQPNPPLPVAPPSKSVSNRRGRSNQSATAAKFTATMLSAYDKGNPPAPPIRGASVRRGHNDSLVSNQAGAPPPPPPPPPVRS